MALKELAAEYRATADGLQTKLAQLRTEVKTARGVNALRMQKRMELLYAELLDVRKIMGYLNHYYH